MVNRGKGLVQIGIRSLAQEVGEAPSGQLTDLLMGRSEINIKPWYVKK